MGVASFARELVRHQRLSYTAGFHNVVQLDLLRFSPDTAVWARNGAERSDVRENQLLLKSSVELGTREQRTLVRELALSSDVIAVNEVADNTEMFAGSLGTTSREKS